MRVHPSALAAAAAAALLLSGGTLAQSRVVFRMPTLGSLESAAQDMKGDHVLTLGREIQVPTRRRSRDRFIAELRSQTLRSRGASVYGGITDDMPELLEDDGIRDQRARAARHIIGNTVGAVIGMVAFHERDAQQGAITHPTFGTMKTGFRLDTSPEWTFRRIGPRTGLRIGLPLTPAAIRIKSWHELRGTDRNPQRLGLGLAIDPFERLITCGLSFDF